MQKRKWFMPVVVISILLMGGMVGGLVVAADNNSSSAEDQSQAANRYEALLDRVCTIYEEKTGVAIDSEQLNDALQQAQGEMQEEVLEDWLENLVDNGKMTQEEADQYLEWWQSRPSIELPLPGLGGHGANGGMMWGRGFGPWHGSGCGPDAADEASD